MLDNIYIYSLTGYTLVSIFIYIYIYIKMDTNVDSFVNIHNLLI